MSRFDSENLNSPHTQRELDQIPQSTPTAEKMAESALARAGLVKRLRSLTRFPAMGGCHMVDDETIDEAADRIDRLERGLAFWQSREAYVSNAFIQAQADLKEAHDQLAAEKALADRFGLAMQVSNSELQAALLAWRKARGL